MIQTFMKVFFGIILRRPVPVALSWNVTGRCNLNCTYCQGPQKDTDELTREQIKNYMKLFHELGTRRIHFIGGEPLLRDDIGKIIESAYALDIQTSLFTNGILVPQRYDKIKALDQISVSFDGAQPIHDRYRGEGTFDKAVEAITFLKKKKHSVRIITTLHQGNLKQIPFILDFSQKNQIPVKFHLLLDELSGKKDITHIVLNKQVMHQWMQYLIKAKKNFDIINSKSSLRYLQHWPNTPFLKCRASGQFLFHISSNGELYACNMTQDVRQKLIPKKEEIVNAMRMVKPKGCARCWCTGTLDLNLMLTFKRDVIAEVVKQYRSH